MKPHPLGHTGRTQAVNEMLKAFRKTAPLITKPTRHDYIRNSLDGRPLIFHPDAIILREGSSQHEPNFEEGTGKIVARHMMAGFLLSLLLHNEMIGSTWNLKRLQIISPSITCKIITECMPHQTAGDGRDTPYQFTQTCAKTWTSSREL